MTADCAARASRRSARATRRTSSIPLRTAPTRRRTRSPTSSARPASHTATSCYQRRESGTGPIPAAFSFRCPCNNLQGVQGREEQDRRVAGIRLLEAQPDLAEGLDAEQAALARRHVVAVLDTVEPGPWTPSG